MNILILCARRAQNSTSIKKLKAAAIERGHTVEICDPTDFYLEVSNKSGHDKIYRKGQRVFANSIDAVIPRIGKGLTYGASVVRHLTENLKIYSTSTADGLLNASDKWKTTQMLSKSRVLTPLSTYVHKPEDPSFLIDLVGGLPCVAKIQRGSQGQGVFILETELAASTTLQSFSAINVNIILQQFIETAKEDEKKSDIRAYVVGDKVSAAYKRFSLDSDFRSNYTISKAGEKVDLTEDEEYMAVAAAKSLQLDVAGVDLARNVNDDRTYCIEVNGNGSLNGISKVTGHDVAGDIIKHVESKVDKGEPSLTRSLSNFLNDLLTLENID